MIYFSYEHEDIKADSAIKESTKTIRNVNNIRASQVIVVIRYLNSTRDKKS